MRYRSSFEACRPPRKSSSIRRFFTAGIAAFGLVLIPVVPTAHEIVGEVTPLMIHMKRALLLIEAGKDRQAIQQIRMVSEDFSHEMGMGMVMEGTGLRKIADGIDAKFGTSLATGLTEALDHADSARLTGIIETLAYLLMLEKFDSLQMTFRTRQPNLDAQRTIFWLGRNYFSYLLEPKLARKDPIGEKRLDRMLDRMLYRLEDREHDEFVRLREELERAIEAAFEFPGDLRSRQG